MTEPKNQRIEQMKSELAELKEAISKERKSGDDVFIAQLMITPIPAKLKMAEATGSEKDIGRARKLIDSLKDELKITSKDAKESFKSVPDVFEHARIYINQAKDAVRRGKKEEATQIYNSIRECFPALTAEQKKEVLPDCSELLRSIRG